MRNWSVRELESIEQDLSYMESLTDMLDCEWLSERISIREQQGEYTVQRCDGCPDDFKIPVVVCVDEYPDEMGAPSSLGISYVCRYHVQRY